MFSLLQPISRPARSDIANGPIGRPKSYSTLSMSQGIAPSISMAFACSWRAYRMRLPTKPGHTPTSAAILPIFLASCIDVAMTDFEVCLARTTSSSRMTFAGEKKCRPMTDSGRFVAVGDLVDVERRRVGREDRALLDDAVELAEHFLLHVHVLEHGFDHQIAIRQRFELERAVEQRHALLDVLHRRACRAWRCVS